MSAVNASSTHASSRARVLRVAAVLGVAALGLSACNGSGSSDADSSGSPSPSTSLPDGVQLTEPGTRLDFGESATVDHDVGAQDALLGITVDSATRGSVKDLSGYDLDTPYKRRGSYYYVQVSVTNQGEDTVSGFPVPLWGLSGEDTLLQPVIFPNRFSKCPTKDLPKKFEPDDELETCLVFLSPNHGSLKGVSYRPSESFLPIEWRGKVEPEKKPQKDKKGSKGKKSKKGKKS